MSSVLEQRVLPGSTALWRRCAAAFRAAGFLQDARSGRRIAFTLSVFAGIALLGAFWGSLVAVAELNALYLCVALIGCAFILLDFRIGVVLLILLMPISVAGTLGSRHVGDIAPAFFMYDPLEFHDAAGYVRDLVAKPLSWVIFA